MMRYALTCAFVAMLSPTAVYPETLTWQVRSNYPYTVHFKLFSQSRNNEWPGGDNVWMLDDYEVKTISISCSYLEKICYGAWPVGDTNSYWGRGNEDDQACDDCCTYCDGGTTKIYNLN